MPKFSVEVSFDLTSEVEVEVDRHAFLDPSGVEEYEDDSYFQTCSVSSSGGDLKFQIVADNDSDAYGEVMEMIHDGQEVEDRNGLTWLLDAVNIQIDEVEEEMTQDKARQVVLNYLNNSAVPSEVLEAIRFLLAATATPFV